MISLILIRTNNGVVMKITHQMNQNMNGHIKWGIMKEFDRGIKSSQKDTRPNKGSIVTFKKRQRWLT